MTTPTLDQQIAETDRGIFPDDFAERLKKRAGEKYRPSNGTEGDIFYKAWCADCQHDAEFRKTRAIGSGCRIWCYAHALNKEHADYPKELQYGPDGQPRCTAHVFERSKAAEEAPTA